MRSYFKIIIGCAVVLSSCQKEVSQLSTGQINDALASDFDFSTSKNVTVNVNYGTKIAIPFSIFAENPVIVSINEDSVRLPTITAIFLTKVLRASSVITTETLSPPNLMLR